MILSMVMNDDSIKKLLQTTSRCRTEIQELAEKLAGSGVDLYNRLTVELITKGADKALGILLNVAAINKIRLDPQVLADSLKAVDILLDVGFPCRYQESDAIGPLLTVAMAEDLSWERQTLAAHLAAELTIKFAQPRQPVKKILWQLSSQVHAFEARLLINSSLALLEDNGAEAPGREMVIDRDILKFLPRERPPVVIGDGGTMRRPVAKLGRNDPCHCGSAKKYKKCCWLRDEEVLRDASSYAGISKSQILAAPALVKDTAPIEKMRAYDLKKLRPELMNDEQLLAGYRRADLFGLRELAFEMLLELKNRPDQEEFAVGHMADLLHEALRNQENDLARRITSQVPADDPTFSAAERLQFEILEHPERYKELEALCRLALVGDDEFGDLPLLDLGHVLEKIHPALSIVFGRAAIVSEPTRIFDNEVLFEVIKRSRISLDLEPWGDPIEEYLEWSIEEHHERSLDRDKDRKIEQLKGQLGEARDKVALAAQELRSKEKELAAFEKKIAEAGKDSPASQPPPAAPTPVQPDPGPPAPAEDSRQQVNLLKRKIDQLKGEITSHQESRRQYRRQLQEAEEVISRLAEHRPEPLDTSEPREDPDSEISTPKKILIPEFTEPFRKSCENLPPAIVAKSLQSAAGFAARNPAILRQAAALERLAGVFRLRIGIHYRLLVRPTPEESLEVLDIIPRAQLENWIRHHAP